MSEPYRDRPPMEGDDDAVTVAAYQTAVEAEMMREYLKDKGIRAAVHESASFNPLVNVAAGGVRLVVRSRDEGRARSLIENLAKEPAATEDDDGAEVGDVRCPRCELTYCFHESALGNGASRAALTSPLLAFFLMPFVFFAGKRWRCHKCLHVWDDPAEGPKKATPLHPDDPRPVFRLRRGSSGGGLLLGILIALLLGMIAANTRAPAVVILPILLAPIAGYVIGKRMTTDVCSSPGCRAVLDAGARDCPSCRGAIAGVIRAAHEHYAEAADVRRELAQLRAAKEAKRLAKGSALDAPKKKKVPAKAKAKKPGPLTSP